MTGEPKGLKSWLQIVRAFSYTASLTTVLLGTSIAIYQGYDFNLWRFLGAFFGVLLFHTAANLINDSYDYEKGLDAVALPMSGGVVRGWITPQQARRIAFICLLPGVVIGLRLAQVAGWPILVLGGLGTALTLGYTNKKVSLKYAGLGDLTIFFTFGLLPVLGAYYVQTGSFDAAPMLWALPLVSFTVGILHANNWHDIDSDPASGCKTVAVFLGDAGSARYYTVLMMGPFLLTALLLALGKLHAGQMQAPLTVLLTLPVAIRARQLVQIGKSKAEAFVMLDGLTAQVQMGFGVLLSLGFLLGKWIG